MAIRSNYVVHLAMFCGHLSHKIRKNKQTNTAQEDVKMHVFKISAGQSGRADIMACPLGAKSGRACQIGFSANARQTVPKAQKKLAEKQ